MPWSSEGGNGGSWKPGSPGLGGKSRARRHLNSRNSSSARRRSSSNGCRDLGDLGGRGLLALALVGTIVWLLSGFYTVGPNEVGLNRIFGRYTGKTAPGLNYNLPIPIGSVEKLQVTDRNTTNIGFGVRQDRAHRMGKSSSPCRKKA